jgi:hypothetical protein
MLLRVHEMIILSALDLYTTVHNKGLRIAIGAFCECRTENILCESGFESLAERRKRKTINTASQCNT